MPSRVVPEPAADIVFGLRKPEAAQFRHLPCAQRLDADETVFVYHDDANNAAAAVFGIRTGPFERAAQCARKLRTPGYL